MYGAEIGSGPSQSVCQTALQLFPFELCAGPAGIGLIEGTYLSQIDLFFVPPVLTNGSLTGVQKTRGQADGCRNSPLCLVMGLEITQPNGPGLMVAMIVRKGAYR